MSDAQKFRTMDALVGFALTAVLGLVGWLLWTTNDHGNRLTAVETQQDATSLRIDEKFDTLIEQNRRTLEDLGELKDEIRELRKQ